MRKAQGISILSLIITIVVIIIFASISIYNGINKSIDDASNTMDYNELFEITEAVAQRALLNQLNSETYKLIGESGDFTVTHERVSGDETVEINRTYSSLDGWYLVKKEDFEHLNLENVRKQYIVNYKTNEVVSFDPIEYEGQKYHSSTDLKDVVAGGDIIISNERYDTDKAVNRPFVVAGMVPVKMQGDNWVITSVDDSDWYDYAAYDSTTNKGNLWANVMLLDEVEVEGMTNAQVRSAKLSDLKGKKVTKEGSMYVWIPRYSQGIVEGQSQIVYSVLTEDYFKREANEVRGVFEDNGVQLTGMWVSKYDAGYIEK